MKCANTFREQTGSFYDQIFYIGDSIPVTINAIFSRQTRFNNCFSYHNIIMIETARYLLSADRLPPLYVFNIYRNARRMQSNFIS